MALRYALLGLLARQPASGYDLTKDFENRLREFAWNARHSQIYPELAKLAAAGLVEVAEEGARGRRTYAITEAGRAEFRAWMLDSPAEPYTRSETNLRLFLLDALDRAEATELLRAFHDWAAREAADLDAVAAEVGPAQPQDEHWPQAMRLDFGRRIFAAERDWAASALEQLDAMRS